MGIFILLNHQQIGRIPLWLHVFSPWSHVPMIHFLQTQPLLTVGIVEGQGEPGVWPWIWSGEDCPTQLKRDFSDAPCPNRGTPEDGGKCDDEPLNLGVPCFQTTPDDQLLNRDTKTLFDDRGGSMTTLLFVVWGHTTWDRKVDLIVHWDLEETTVKNIAWWIWAMNGVVFLVLKMPAATLV